MTSKFYTLLRKKLLTISSRGNIFGLRIIQTGPLLLITSFKVQFKSEKPQEVFKAYKPEKVFS
jgi:hypothetical protein